MLSIANIKKYSFMSFKSIKIAIQKTLDPEEKYSLLVELANTVVKPDSNFLIPNYLIKNCQSKVWLYPIEEESKLVLKVWGESKIILAFCILAIDLSKDSQTIAIPQELFNATISIYKLESFFSSSRVLGLSLICEQIHLFYHNKSSLL
jgi:sulfur transfer protein SufE